MKIFIIINVIIGIVDFLLYLTILLPLANILKKYNMLEFNLKYNIFVMVKFFFISLVPIFNIVVLYVLIQKNKAKVQYVLINNKKLKDVLEKFKSME